MISTWMKNIKKTRLKLSLKSEKNFIKKWWCEAYPFWFFLLKKKLCKAYMFETFYFCIRIKSDFFSAQKLINKAHCNFLQTLKNKVFRYFMHRIKKSVTLQVYKAKHVYKKSGWWERNIFFVASACQTYTRHKVKLIRYL